MMSSSQPARSEIYEIAHAYVDQAAALDPLLATAIGIPGSEGALPDLSPAGEDERAWLVRETMAELRAIAPATDRDRIARDVMFERLHYTLGLFEQDEHLRPIRVLGSPVQSLRMAFDIMPKESDEDWVHVATRMRAVPAALGGLRETLEAGVQSDVLGARRQALAVAKQASTWGGAGDGETSFFHTLAASREAAAGAGDALSDDLNASAEVAAEAYRDLAEYLAGPYAEASVDRDAVGPARYMMFARGFTGAALDLGETYDWGWGEVARLDEEIRAVTEQILPGATLDETRAALDAGTVGPTDSPRVLESEAEFHRWMQELQEGTIAELDGQHFDIPGPVKRIEAMIAPPGGALAMYYRGPSEDFSRPGRTWYPTGGRTRFPLWPEVAIAYHEGVPGHHLQIATTVHMGEELSRFQRLQASVPGYVEGWGLYAERLMSELGYVDEPAHRLGMLISQAFRAARVVVDIGLHLELDIPEESGFHPGESWTPELALEFMTPRSPFTGDFVRSEVDRYLGLPAQAISYKVGERFWLDARAAAKEREGAAFNLKEWHAKALAAGPMGLDQMRQVLAG